MSAFLYSVALQWKLDLRNKGVLLTYYIVPLVFFFFIGGVFTSINPSSKNTLIQSMTVFGVTMGAFLGAPTPLAELYGSEIKKAYKVGGIPLYVAAVNNFISAFIHLFIMSLVIFLIAPITFNASYPTNLVLYFISLAIFIIACLAVGTALGLLVRNGSKLTMVSQLIFLPSIMLSGIMFPTDILPGILKNIGMIFPATWGFEIMKHKSIAFSSMLPLLVILAIAVSIGIWQITRLKAD